jgi:hypothetical protein
MSTPSSSYSINGEEPQLAGTRCTGFYLQHFYEGPQVTDQVNVAYLRFDGQWYRLYFECATIFWRRSEEPEVPENSELAYGLLLNNMSGMASVVGQEFESLAYSASESGDVQVRLSFRNGKFLQFLHNCHADSTQLVG